MKRLNKGLMSVLITSIVFNIFLYFFSIDIDGKIRSNDAVKVSVLLRKADDPYEGLIKESFERIQKENEGKVDFTFYDCKGNQLLQNQILDSILKANKTDLVFIHIEEMKGSKYVIDKVKEKNIPIVLYSGEPLDLDSIRSYNKAYFVGTKAEEAGALQGKILVDLWKKKHMDRNGDNILQYVMLMGDKNNLEAIGRTKYAVLSINDAGIRTEELALRICNWDEKTARDVMEQVILQKGDKIEAIIANNDAMAIGAIEALQKYGYNKGDGSRVIPVVGVDAIPKAKELISQGIMAGSVIQDADGMAKAVYDIGMNLVNNKSPLDGTQYKFDDTGVSVRIPYKEYTNAV